MNLRAAQKELRGRAPEVAGSDLALETVVIVAISVFLVGWLA